MTNGVYYLRVGSPFVFICGDFDLVGILNRYRLVTLMIMKRVMRSKINNKNLYLLSFILWVNREISKFDYYET